MPTHEIPPRFGRPRLQVAGLVVARGARVLTGPLDVALQAGEALAVTGPNGAGKSTLLRVLYGLLPAAAGAVTVEGIRAADGEPARRLGEAAHYLGHRHAMKAAETVAANLAFWRGFLGAPGLEVAAALDAVGLRHAEHLPFAFLSAGQQRRAALARLLVVRRPVWLLDEPTAALDAGARQTFAHLAETHLAGGGLIVAATHEPLGFPARTLRLETPPPADDAALAIADAWA